MLAGHLALTIDDQVHELAAGDCLRYHLHGPSVFRTKAEQPARYLVVLV